MVDGLKQPLNHQWNPQNSVTLSKNGSFVFLYLNFKIHKLLNTDKSTKITIENKNMKQNLPKEEAFKNNSNNTLPFKELLTMPKV